MLRLYDPTEGAIYLNGIDIRDIDYEDYCRIFSTVFQDFNLFSLTLRENLILGDEHITDEEIVEAAIHVCKVFEGQPDGRRWPVCL